MDVKPCRSIGTRSPRARRAAAVVQVAIALTTLLGFSALAVDVGIMYNARVELQRTADSCALAAASELGDYVNGDPLVAARNLAIDFASRNEVANAGVGLANQDVIFGRAEQDPVTGKYTFTPTDTFPNAVRVITRRTAGSPSGPIGLLFANVFGVQSADIAAQATALLRPRDMVFVLDLSTSHNDDSSLRSFKNLDIANHGVWASLWDDALAGQPVGASGPEGPPLGNMSAWGDDVTGPSWDFASDSGLTSLPKGSGWSLNSSTVSHTLNAKGFGQYTSDEMTAINSSSYDSTTSDYQRRVLVALGVYRWKSGKSGGQPGGNGDDRIDSGEIQVMVPYPGNASNPDTFHKEVGGTWTDFVEYVRLSSSSMSKYDPSNGFYGDPGLRYRFGLKTWVDYLQEKQYGNANSPGFAGSPQQPMGAVIDSTQMCIDIIESLQSDDLIGLAGYGTVGYGPDDRPDNMSWLVEEFSIIQERIGGLQPGMWTSNTNISQGIDEGVNVVMNSPDARPNAEKTMFLLTDGIANQVRANPTYWDEYQAKLDTKEAAQDARDLGIRIYAISVGASADQDLMEDVASIAGGEHFHAEGDIATYSAQLQDIFQKLGGKAPVMLIE